MAKGIYVGVKTLPAGYKLLEYIESTGTQYIDTLVQHSSSVKCGLEAVVAYTTLSPSHQIMGFSGNSGNGIGLAGSAWWETPDIPYTSVGKKNLIAWDVDGTIWHRSVSGTQRQGYRTTMDFTKNMFLFAALDTVTSSEMNYYCHCKLYSAKVIVGGVTVRDFIPCMTESGEVGLYDSIDGKFYGNSGSGSFVAGSEVADSATPTARKVKKTYIGIQQFEPRELPEGYTQVEYIESNGTQYIDTGFKPNNNTRVVMDYNLISGKPPVMFGAMDSWVSKGFAYISNEAMDTLTICYGANFYTPTANTAGRHIIDANKNVFSLDGTVVQTCTEVSFQSNYNLILFGYNNGGTVTTKNTIVYIYSCQIYDNGTLIRDYVPCTNQTGVGGLYDLVNMKFYGNAGTGTFAVGTSATSTARKVKKGYIGIGGVARPFMSGGELAYYGTITALGVARYSLAATTVGDYALFGGGNYNNTAYPSVDSYDVSLVKSTATNLSKGRWLLATTTVGNYALFAGGETRNSIDTIVDTYNTSLTKGTATNLSEARYQLAATTVGDYALFGGGFGTSPTRTVDAYNSSLQRTIPTTLAKARYCLAATTVGNYALFGGGARTSTDSAVDAYDSSLTRTIATTLSQARYCLAATTVGDYALFGGGYDDNYGSTSTDAVDVYNSSLTRTTTSLTFTLFDGAATTVGDYAIFGGVYNGDDTSPVIVFDTSLTRTVSYKLSAMRSELAATTVGNYALFGGGSNNMEGTYQSTVDAFVVA